MKKQWIAVGILIFIIVMSLYLGTRPKVLASPGSEFYISKQTITLGIFVLIGSLTLAFVLELARKKFDEHVLGKSNNDERKKSKNKRFIKQKHL